MKKPTRNRDKTETAVGRSFNVMQPKSAKNVIPLSVTKIPDVKGGNSNPPQQRKADRYLWYWKPLLNGIEPRYHFDRDHWWKRTPKDVSHDAALYELLRRHPAVGELQRQTLRSSQETTAHQTVRAVVLKGPNPVTVTLGPDPVSHVANAIFGFFHRPWTKLSKEQQAIFQNSLKVTYPGKGRDLTKGVFDLTDAAQKWAESEKDVGGPSFEEFLSRNDAIGSDF